MLWSPQDIYKGSDPHSWSPWCWGNWVPAQQWGTVGRALTGLIKSSVEGAIRNIDVNLFCDFSFLPRSSLMAAVSLWEAQPEHKAYYQANFCLMLCFLAAALVKKLFYQTLSQCILKPFFFFPSVRGCCRALIHLFILNLWRLVSPQLPVADDPAVSCASSECTGWHFCL